MNLSSILIVLGVSFVFFILLLIPLVLIIKKIIDGTMKPGTAKVFSLCVFLLIAVVFILFMGILKAIQG